MRRSPILLLVPVLAMGLLAGCGDDGAGSNEPARDAWDEQALDRAGELRQQLESAGIACTDYGPHDFATFRVDYERAQVPVPAASVGCTTLDEYGDEDELYFEVFRDEGDKEDFVQGKVGLICERAREYNPDEIVDALPYVEGDEWIIEPDTFATAEQVAPAVGGEARSMCVDDAT